MFTLESFVLGIIFFIAIAAIIFLPPGFVYGMYKMVLKKKFDLMVVPYWAILGTIVGICLIIILAFCVIGYVGFEILNAIRNPNLG